MLEQPNLSTGGSILICALIMLFCAGLKKRHLTLLSAGGLCLEMCIRDSALKCP